MANKILPLVALICSLLSMTLITSCKQQGKVSVIEDNVPMDLVQAILKTQPSIYDPADKNRITGDYVDQKKVNVPKGLTGQNKWIMFEGPVLENDKVAYRYYADARHRFDIYGKLVSDLVMDTVSWDYHDIMDWGSDILKVGNSLGIGSPAILYQDSIYALEEWNSKTIEIIKDTDTKAIIRTIFSGLKIGDISMNVQQDWSIMAGVYDTTIDIKRMDGDLPSSMKFATGIVSHLDKVITSSDSNGYYSYTWGNQSFHKQNLGMAVMANSKYQPRVLENALTHITVFDDSKAGVEYKFMAIWADGIGNIKTEEQFLSALQEVVSN